jgi:hypothetical protein
MNPHELVSHALVKQLTTRRYIAATILLVCRRNLGINSSMEPENLDVEQITEDRRKAIEKSIQVISIEDLKSLGEKLFPFLDHPWRQVFFQFIEEHPTDTFYHGTTLDQVEIVYCPATERGMWFTHGRGMGPLQGRGVEIMKEIVGKQ